MKQFNSDQALRFIQKHVPGSNPDNIYTILTCQGLLTKKSNKYSGSFSKEEAIRIIEKMGGGFNGSLRD